MSSCLVNRLVLSCLAYCLVFLLSCDIPALSLFFCLLAFSCVDLPYLVQLSTFVPPLLFFVLPPLPLSCLLYVLPPLLSCQKSLGARIAHLRLLVFTFTGRSNLDSLA